MASPSAFLARAKDALGRFDAESDIAALLTAALELRFGIEARLYQYIDAELSHAKSARKYIHDHAASKLLARLTSLNPKAMLESIHQLTPDEGGKAVVFAYTPVTKELASIHGRLGGLLHYTFFWQNPYWKLKNLEYEKGLGPIAEARELVARGLEDLTLALSGNLLNNPSFAVAVKELNDVPPTGDSQSPDPT